MKKELLQQKEEMVRQGFEELLQSEEVMEMKELQGEWNGISAKQIYSEYQDMKYEVLENIERFGYLMSDLVEESQEVVDIIKCDLHVAYSQLGYQGLVGRLNEQIENSHFCISFEEEDFSVMNGGFEDIYEGLFIPYQTLSIRKPFDHAELADLIHLMNKVCQVERLEVNDTHILADISAHEGPCVDSIATTVDAVNNLIGPYLKQQVEKLNVTDYQLDFVIRKMY
ncbi:hypothetical protein [Salimicrobium flavidum]|uniref:Uncharacterized protein n=1 Tax=Salimicrobium flavidum TaxID=570947 RepID=A0A1N7IWR6_9BACI|nr:hypothetical protein [Salimicrobium flavidum]SIS41519.1 hypothetical protein SAMN05421687_102375 [Salimicrobium flavidum]